MKLCVRALSWSVSLSHHRRRGCQVRETDPMCVDGMDEFASTLYQQDHEQQSLGFSPDPASPTLPVALSRLGLTPTSIPPLSRRVTNIIDASG
jgi:hypothetical protein